MTSIIIYTFFFNQGQISMLPYFTVFTANLGPSNILANSFLIKTFIVKNKLQLWKLRIDSQLERHPKQSKLKRGIAPPIVAKLGMDIVTIFLLFLFSPLCSLTSVDQITSIQSAVMLILPSWSAAVPSLTTRQNPQPPGPFDAELPQVSSCDL